MEISKLQEINKKAPKAGKDELIMFLNRLALPTEAVKVGDVVEFPAEINAVNGTFVKGVVNGNTFFSVAVTRNGNDAINLSIGALTRRFVDNETNTTVTPLNIIAEEDKPKALYTMFEGKTIGEALNELQGKKATLKAQEAFEGVARDGNPMRVLVNGWILE